MSLESSLVSSHTRCALGSPGQKLVCQSSVTALGLAFVPVCEESFLLFGAASMAEVSWSSVPLSCSQWMLGCVSGFCLSWRELPQSVCHSTSACAHRAARTLPCASQDDLSPGSMTS